MANSGGAIKLNPRSTYRRWLVLFMMGVTFFFIEAIDHYQPGNPQVFKPEFWHRLPIYVIILPVMGGIVLNRLERTIIERNQVMAEIDKQYTFSRQLSNTIELADLAENFVRFPSIIAPVLAAYLHVYDPKSVRLEPAASWIATGNPLGLESTLLLHDCQYRQMAMSSNTCSLTACQHPRNYVRAFDLNRYCLTLVHGDQATALLHLDFPSDQTITSRQIQMLVGVAPEMALAIKCAHLQQSVQAQAEARVAERKRIAQNLHDTFAQDITYLRTKLDQFSELGNFQDMIATQQDIRRMRDTANEAYDQIRATLLDLDPISKADLAIDLRNHADLVAERTGIKFQLTVSGQPAELPKRISRQVLYICREALNNVEKHARAENAGADLIWEEDSLTISIWDDGIGFKSTPFRCQGQLGLEIMKERAQAMNGLLGIKSTLNQGTKISLSLPLCPRE
jgi:signal transduction histidine kinase